MTKQQHKKFSAKSTMLAEISEQKGQKSKKNFPMHNFLPPISGWETDKHKKFSKIWKVDNHTFQKSIYVHGV